jgi:hypothetical protein
LLHDSDTIVKLIVIILMSKERQLHTTLLKTKQ